MSNELNSYDGILRVQASEIDDALKLENLVVGLENGPGGSILGLQNVVWMKVFVTG